MCTGEYFELFQFRRILRCASFQTRPTRATHITEWLGPYLRASRAKQLLIGPTSDFLPILGRKYNEASTYTVGRYNQQKLHTTHLGIIYL